jgi:hypothetical protein
VAGLPLATLTWYRRQSASWCRTRGRAGEGSERGHGGEERHDNVGEEHGGFWRWGEERRVGEGVVDGEKSAFFRRAGEDEVGGDDGGLRRTSPQFLTVMRTFLDPMDPRCLETGSCSLTRHPSLPSLAALTALVRQTGRTLARVCTVCCCHVTRQALTSRHVGSIGTYVSCFACLLAGGRRMFRRC